MILTLDLHSTFAHKIPTRDRSGPALSEKITVDEVKMSSALAPPPDPPQSVLPHLDHLLRLFVASAEPSSPSSTDHQAEIAATASNLRNQLAESTKWAATLKGGDVAEGEVDEVIAVLTERLQKQRFVLISREGAASWNLTRNLLPRLQTGARVAEGKRHFRTSP